MFLLGLVKMGESWKGRVAVKFKDGEVVGLDLVSAKDPKIEAACTEFERALKEVQSERARSWS